MTDEAPAPPPAPQPRRSISRKKRAVFIVLAFAVGAIAALSGGELFLRIFNPLGVRERASWHFLLWDGLRPSADPELVWENVPGYHRRLVGYDVSISSLGFRGDEIAARKPPGAWRLLCLGDSMTYGMSAPQGDAFPAQLQAMLRERFPAAAIQVLNGGVLGYTTLQEEELLRTRFPLVEPDAVVLWWFHNDVVLTGRANPAPQADQLRDLIGIRPRTPMRWLLHQCYELVPCFTALARSATVARNEGDQSHFQFDAASNPQGWAANRASLERIIVFCQSHHTPLVIYTFGKYPEIEEICRRAGVPYATSVERAGKEHEVEYAVAPSDPHFNRAGNRLVAQTILKALLDHRLAPGSAAPIEARVPPPAGAAPRLFQQP